MEKIDKQFVAVRAVVVKDGKVLIIRESQDYEGGNNKGKYDFPGGKIQIGESIKEALLRETKEEAGLEVKPGRVFFADEWRPIVNGEKFQIFGIYFLCEPLVTNVVLGKDHDDYKWINPKDYEKYPLNDATKNALKALTERGL